MWKCFWSSWFIWILSVKIKRQAGPGQIRLENLLKSLKDKQAKVGWFETSKYPKGVPVAYVATIHEFGYGGKNIPARPFMRPTVTEKQNEWKSIINDKTKLLLEGSFELDDLMNLIGLKASGDIRYTITTILDPPLKEETVNARRRQMANKQVVGSLTKPLVFTGYLLNSLTYTVENK